MKNKILSFTGRSLRGRRLNDPEITRKSPGNHAVITRFWKVITMVVFLFTLAIGQMWGATETTPSSNGTNNADLVGVSYTIPGACNPKGTNAVGSYTGVKMRTNQTATVNGESVSKCWYMNINEGYKITAATFYMTYNSSAETIKNIYVDDALYSSPNEALNAKGGTAKVFSITGVNATKQIVFEGTNEQQIFLYATFTYEATGGGGGGGDTEAPTLSSSTPANEATEVAVSGNIVLTFSEAIANVDASKFTLTGATKGTVTIDGTDAKKVNVGYTAENNASVTLAVAADAVADAAGNKSAALSNISFTTAAGTSYPEGYIYITDVKATPETGATATVSSMNSYNTNLNSNFDKGNFTGTKYAITSSSSGNYTLTFSPALDVSTYSNLKLDVWWGTNGTGSNSGIKVNVNGTEVYSAATSQSTRNKIQTGLDRAITATSISTIQLKGNNNSGTVFFRVGIKGESTPSCSAPTSPTISGETAYTEGDNISMTASATGTDGSTTYTWYKGEDWATASAGSSIGSTATFTKNSCVEGDAGKYWCNISNGTGCEVQVSKTITVAAAGAVESNIIYTETKGASNPNPTKYVEGTGIASFEPLGDVANFHFTGWSPASIAADATGDQTIEAQWVAAYDVTFDKGLATGTAPDAFQKWNGAKFNLPGQGSMVAPANTVFDGWKANGVGETLAANTEYTMTAAAVQFVAQWKPVIKLVLQDGSDYSINTTNFSAVDASLMTESVSVEGTSFVRTVKVGGAASGISNIDALKKVIAYETTTDATHVKIYFYDGYSSSTTHNAYVMIVKEGETTPVVNETINIPTGSKRDHVREYNLTGHSNLYICVKQQDVRVCQIEVNENGTALAGLEAPAVGYSINLNKGRLLAPVKQTNTAYEGLTYNLAEKYLPGSSADARIKNLNSEFISFVVPTGQTRQLQLTTSNTNKYTVSKTKGDDQNQFTPTANTAKNWNLTAGTWYINPQGSNVQITNIAFAAAPATHTISFDSDGGSDVASIAVFDGDKATAPAAPTKANHTFSKWVVESSGADFDWTEAVTTDVELKAIWTPYPKLTLTAGEGATGEDVVAYKEPASTVEVPAKPDGFSNETKNFDGWTYSSSVTMVDETHFTMPSTDLTLTAKWVSAFTVSYYDGENELGSESVEAGNHPANYANYQTKADYTFIGWYNNADLAAEHVVANIAAEEINGTVAYYGKWVANSDNTLTDLKVNGATVEGFAPGTGIYYITVPYGTAIADMPVITAYTCANPNATPVLWPTDAPVWNDTYQCYLQMVEVTPADGTSAHGYYHIRINHGAKDMLCLIKAEHDNTASGATISGFYGGTKDKNTYANGKLGVKDNYMGIKLAEEAGTFKAGDVLKIYAPTTSAKVRIYSDKGTTRINAEDGTFDSEKMFTYTLTDDEEWIYLYRRTDGESDMNPTLGYMAVYRAYPKPIMTEMSINGEDATIDGVNVSVEIPYNADLANLNIEKTFMSNDPSQTTGALVGAAWILSDEGTNTYRVTDKDGDYTDYIITLTRAAHYEAKIGDTGYATLVEAVAAAVDGDVVKLMEDVNAGAGVMIAKADAKQITIDFGGYTYKAVAPAVGSAGTQNQAFHFEKGCDITLKNGTITSEGSVIKMLIQNYGDLTLEDITLDGSGLEGSHRYVLSNNCGDVVIGNGTTITAKDGDVAFDVCATNYYPEGVKVTVEAGATVNGIVEYDVWGTKPADNKAELAIEGGTLNITWNVESALAEDAKANLNVSGGQFSEVVPADYCAEGFAPVTEPNAQGKYEVEDKRIYIFDGSTMSNIATSPSGAISWEIVGSTMGAGDKDKTYEGVHYTRALSCGSSSTTKHFRIDVALNNAAKIEVIGMSNSSSDTRHAWLTNSTEKGDFADAIAGLTTTGYNPEMFATDWLEEGSYYLHSDNTVAIFLIRVTSKEVDPKCEQPTITTQPATDLTFGAGNMTATVVAEVSDEGTLTYQWYNAANDEAVVGQTTATLTTAEEGTYYVIVTNTKASHRDNSIKSADATLAHRVMNDATLSALSYGGTAIALEADKYEYRVDLAMGTIDVPELTATATMAPYPTVVITNATEFVNYEATSTVVVTSEDGTATKTYTVKFVVDHVYTALVDVTESTTWNWSGSTEAVINDVANKGLIIANYIDGANFEMIEGKENERARRNQNGGVYQGTHLHFNTTVAGKVKFYFRAPSSGENCTITVINNGKEMVAGTRGNSFGWSKEIVVKGDVVIEMVNDKQGGGETRVQQIVFTELTPDYTRNVSNNIGTLCVDHNVVVGGAMGATFYQIASRNELYDYKIDFEEVLPNEELKAGEPYIFKSTTGRIDLFFGNTEVEDSVVVRGMYGVLHGGKLEIKEENMMDVYYIQDNKLRDCSNLISSGLNLVANRAYIVMSEVPTYAEYQALQQQQNSAPRRRVTLGKDAEQIATGFENINAGDKPMKLMINGQIFILRGEKVFDATGRLVK